MTLALEEIADRLSGVSADDRAWVLAQLETDDRIRLLSMLRDYHAEEIGVTAPDNTAAARIDSASHTVLPGQYDPLDAAEPDAVIKLLATEPDWLVAILVAEAKWPWVEPYLASLDEARLNRIGALVRAQYDLLRPEVRKFVTNLLRESLQQRNVPQPTTSLFDVILDRVRGAVSEQTMQSEPASV